MRRRGRAVRAGPASRRSVSTRKTGQGGWLFQIRSPSPNLPLFQICSLPSREGKVNTCGTAMSEENNKGRDDYC
jgi:hypothetical protein